MNSRQLHVQLACIWEATARKPGNVHRFADFVDVNYLDFLTSAAAIALILGSAAERPIGETILRSVQATRQVTETNTNLGIILLLAPLCAVPSGQSLTGAVPEILENLTVDDSCRVFEAIRLARPGGLGQVDEQDIHAEPTLPLHQIMVLAAERDSIARQYSNGFREVLKVGCPALLDGVNHFGALEPAIVHCHLYLLAHLTDSLIARKRGQAEAAEASRRAAELFEGDWQRDPARPQKIDEYDKWLRATGHSRNPGTTADLVTACLFVALQESMITVPLRIPWSLG